MWIFVGTIDDIDEIAQYNTKYAQFLSALSVFSFQIFVICKK